MLASSSSANARPDNNNNNNSNRHNAVAGSPISNMDSDSLLRRDDELDAVNVDVVDSNGDGVYNNMNIVDNKIDTIDGTGGDDNDNADTIIVSNPNQPDDINGDQSSSDEEISVTIYPPIVLTLYCTGTTPAATTSASVVPCDAAPSEEELMQLSSIATKYITSTSKHSLELAYGVELEGMTGVDYSSLELVASLLALPPEPMRRFVRRGRHNRRLNQQEGNTNTIIVLSGTANFSISTLPDNTDGTVMFDYEEFGTAMERQLSDYLFKVFSDHQAEFVDVIKNERDSVDASSWFARLMRYDTSLALESGDLDLAQSQASSSSAVGQGGQSVSGSGGSSVENGLEEGASEDFGNGGSAVTSFDPSASQGKAGVKEEAGAVGGAIDVDTTSIPSTENNDSSNPPIIAGATDGNNQPLATNAEGSSSNNTLLIVGAIGICVSLLALLAGLWYAKKSYNEKNHGDGMESEDVVFQPGKNNPRSTDDNGSGKKRMSSSSSSRIFKKKSSKGLANSGGNGRGYASSSMLPDVADPALPTHAEPSVVDNDNDDSDDEDFLLARAALNKKKGGNNYASSQDNDGKSVTNDDEESQANMTFGDDMSYAFTVEGESLAPLNNTNNSKNIINKDASSTANASDNNTNNEEDGMIGAGGLASFSNDKGIFRWNDDGTKMVYTPKVSSSGDHQQTNVNNSNDPDQNNGFVFDQAKKKWVVKEQVIGEKNVSFQPSANSTLSVSDPVPVGSIMRTRSGDSAMTGLTGMSEFTYDDVALDNMKRSRSGGSGTDNSSIGMGIMSGTNSLGMSPASPATPQDEGVEVPLSHSPGGGIIQPTKSFESEFAPNTNVERFMNDADDDDTAFSGMTGMTGFTDTASFAQTYGGGGDGGGMPSNNNHQPRPVTPERSVATFATGDPGRIMPKKSVNRPNKMKIAEDAPFDEDIPFDERTRTGGSSSIAAQKNNIAKSGLVIPNILDDYGDYGDDDASESEGSTGSEQVLEDLDKLSRFMMERKHSSKSNASQTTSSGRSRRKGSNGYGSGKSGKRLGRR